MTSRILPPGMRRSRTVDGVLRLPYLRGRSTGGLRGALRDLKRVGLQAPVLAIGGGALAFWNAVGEIWPVTKEQQDWVHRIVNVLDKLPKWLQGSAKAALREIMSGPDTGRPRGGHGPLRGRLRCQVPEGRDGRDQEQLLDCFDFPAEHRKPIRTSSPMEATFATVRLRQRVTRGPGSRIRGLTMVFKVTQMAQDR